VLKTDHPAKHFVVPLLAAMVIYLIAYGGIEHLRNRKGPWQVTFTRGPADPGAFPNSAGPLAKEVDERRSSNSIGAGFPALLINQPMLHITNVQIVFTNQPPFTNPPAHLIFAQPQPVPYDLPFGNCIFMDTTFLPGTLTMRLFGHELELLPRVLIIDHEEHPWRSQETIALDHLKMSPAPPESPR
jgi:hypothetical protein